VHIDVQILLIVQRVFRRICNARFAPKVNTHEAPQRPHACNTIVTRIPLDFS
jgi:hypothetical protein